MDPHKKCSRQADKWTSVSPCPAADSHAEYSVISELKQTWAGEFAKGYVFGLAKMSDGAYMSVSPVGPDKKCSPRHVSPFDSRNEGVQCG